MLGAASYSPDRNKILQAQINQFKKETDDFASSCDQLRSSDFFCHAAAIESLNLKSQGRKLLQKRAFSKDQKESIQSAIDNVATIHRQLKAPAFEVNHCEKLYEGIYSLTKNVLSSDSSDLEAFKSRVDGVKTVWMRYIGKLKRLNESTIDMMKKFPENERAPFFKAEEARIILWGKADEQIELLEETLSHLPNNSEK